MQDRPDIVSLLEAVQEFLIKDVMQLAKENDFASYKALVSWNMLGVAIREIETGATSINHELDQMTEYLGKPPVDRSEAYIEKTKIMRKLNEELSEKIRRDKLDDTDSQVWSMVKQSVVEKLEVSNPRFKSG
jgi:hypothetical protein